MGIRLIWRITGLALIAVAALTLIGLGIGTHATVPSDAPVYYDIEAKTYLAPPCMPVWLERRRSLSGLRNGTISEAHRLNFAPDADCQQSGALAPADRSLTRQLLVKLGLLPPIKHWWEGPYRAAVRQIR